MKRLMKGNEALARAAILGGLDAFFGYPITPQNEIPEYLSKHLPEAGKVFVQAESEIAAINMVYGAAAAGVRALTSSSSPGIALMQEGISYLCGAELPCVIINVMRGGPGLGGIQPSQADYFQITRGGGNGDYRVLSFAPENLQEAVDLMREAFDIADAYRNPVMIVVDGLIGQMMETVDLDWEVPKRVLPEKDWAVDGKSTRRTRRIVNSLYLDPAELERHNLKLLEKYRKMEAKEQRYEIANMDGAEFAIVAYGTMARIARSSIELLEETGVKTGLIKPISLWPFPKKAFENLPESLRGLLVAELSLGQMIDDVRIVNQGRLPVRFFGRTGGILPEPEEIGEAVLRLKEEVA